ncbi:hypothetical protein CW304_22555 [Bacillus sp. UFRGS-B20]|nr:hypothetical protein CW304_22555 [Bacillus sp. UFRGS-B20]
MQAFLISFLVTEFLFRGPSSRRIHKAVVGSFLQTELLASSPIFCFNFLPASCARCLSHQPSFCFFFV